MAKPLFVFAGGFACGIAIACGAALLFPRPTGNPKSDSVPLRNATAQAVTMNPAAPGEIAASTPVLEDRIARLKRWIAGQEPSLVREEIDEILANWSALHPMAVLQFVSDAKRFPDRNRALAIPLAVIAQKNLVSVIDWLRRNHVATARGEIAEYVIRELKDANPAAALELAFAPDIPVDTSSFGQILDILITRNPALALSGFARLSESGQRDVAQSLGKAWYQHDPAAALVWFETQRSTENAPDLTKGLLAGAVRRGDPAALAALLDRFNPDADALAELADECREVQDQPVAELVFRRLSAEQLQYEASRWVMQHLDSAPDETLAFMRSLLPSKAQGAAFEEGFQSWLFSDRKAAAAWLDTLADPVLVQHLRGVLEADRSSADPAIVLSEYEKHGAQPHQTEETINRALRAQAGADPARAAAWISRHLETTQASAAAYVASEFLGRDGAAATQWIASLPKGAVQDQALGEAASYWSDRGNLRSASDSVNAITDPSSRLSAMFLVFAQAAANDRATALHWAEEQGLSEETRMTWIAIAGRLGGR